MVLGQGHSRRRSQESAGQPVAGTERAPNTEGTTASRHECADVDREERHAGCIRMNNADVEWLFDTIPTGTKVKIHA